MKIKNFIRLTILIVFSCTIILFQYEARAAEKINFAVIFLGGPDTGAEGEKIITQFINSLSKLTGMTKDSMQGDYFNNISSAKTYIQQHKNTYIMGSLGFYLTNRKTMNLVPLATVKLRGNDEEQYYLIVKKGQYKSLKELKGKILAGNIVYEDKKFLSKMIFNNSIDVEQYFSLKPTNRPLTAIKKLIKGEFDSVLVNSMQYNNLKKLSEFDKIKIIHESPKMPALGLMMVDTSRNNAVKSKIVNAVTKMCNQNDTKDACTGFGIDGFDSIKAETLDNEIKKFEKTQ